MEIAIAPGAPGSAARWFSSVKEGVGTALSDASNVWFTLSEGIVSEVCYPRIDIANIRDVSFIITDGQSFFSEERRHTQHEYSTEGAGIPAYHMVNHCKEGRYRLKKRVIADPLRPVLLQEVIFEPLQGRLGDYKLYLLLAPHIKNMGMQNTGWVGDCKGYPTLFAERDGVALAALSSSHFIRLSCGYVGVSDPWRDLSAHKALTTCYKRAEGGNIALAAEIDLESCKGRFVIALAFGSNDCEAGLRARSALTLGFESPWDEYVAKWKLFQEQFVDDVDSDISIRKLFRNSLSILKSHEGKRLPGSVIASLSVPWGYAREDYSAGGYHLIWPRNQVQVAKAFLASGHSSTAREILLFLMSTQERDGHWLECFGQDGVPLSTCLQADETALPILLADLLRRKVALETLNPTQMVQKAASFLIQKGPATQKDRWQSDSGYTAYTLASVIAALLAAADFIAEAGELAAAEYLREIADWWNESIERWLYVTNTELAHLCSVPGYYARMMLVDKVEDRRSFNNNTNESVSVDALSLVRFGLRHPDAPEIVQTVKVIDTVLRSETEQGPLWHRYSGDSYGETNDGSPYNGDGIGRGWPLLSGERAHYELANGNIQTAKELLSSIVAFGGSGGLIPEQIWDSEDMANKDLYKGKATGSARPLVGAHAEFLLLLRSLHDNAIFDRPPQTYQRYLVNKVKPLYGLWRFNNQLLQLPKGKRLRIQTGGDGLVRWSVDNWTTYADVPFRPLPLLGIFYGDLPVEKLAEGVLVHFTFFWEASQQWEGQNFQVQIV